MAVFLALLTMLSIIMAPSRVAPVPHVFRRALKLGNTSDGHLFLRWQRVSGPPLSQPTQCLEAVQLRPSSLMTREAVGRQPLS